MSILRKSLFLLIIAVITQGCMLTQTADSGLQTVEDKTPITVNGLPSTVPNTPLPLLTVVPATLELSPTPLPKITISAVKGNLYIRRGPGLEYNQIGVLLKDTSTEVIARDVLSNWLQVLIPNSDNTGWVSIQTIYSKIDGDLDKLPDFTFTDWPLPAYIKNCTEHDMFITPGDIYLPNLYTNAQYKNEVQVNPGSYTAFDLFVPGEPEAQKFEIREGVQVYITINGLGVKHKCP
ncbi:MAG: SH3 domain-containing protein [Anaerolineales bacterium]|nr:SH3 domain-containing protein [Anaerolineales bacterium]